MNRNFTIGLVLFVILASFLLSRRPQRQRTEKEIEITREGTDPAPGEEPIARPKSTSAPRRPPVAPRMPKPQQIQIATSPRIVSAAPSVATKGPKPEPKKGMLIPFVIEDGLAVTMGDIALGVPQEMRPGVTDMRRPDRWKSPRLVFHIQPDLPNPERVMQAFQLFEGTPITFVPFDTQEDVLVFQNGTGACKSYLGRIGGKQPIWLSPTCGPVEIAHEIMHALGFIHEQNRDDRDQFVRVLMENVEPGNDINFERLPHEYMGLTGLSPFDYTSIMLYPKTMFGVGGRDTVESVRPGSEIEPSRRLSPLDRDRLMRAFGGTGR